MDIETFEWLMAKPHLEVAFTGGALDGFNMDDIMHALVTCALELDRFALLSSSHEQSQPMNRAADLIVKAIKAIDALATRPGAGEGE